MISLEFHFNNKVELFSGRKPESELSSVLAKSATLFQQDFISKQLFCRKSKSTVCGVYVRLQCKDHESTSLYGPYRLHQLLSSRFAKSISSLKAQRPVVAESNSKTIYEPFAVKTLKPSETVIANAEESKEILHKE